MKLYIRAHDLGVKGTENILRQTEELGLDGVQLVAYKALENVPYAVGGITAEKARCIGRAFDVAHKEIALIGAYFNPVHSNAAKLECCKNIFKEYLGCAKYLGCNLVGSETGSFNDDKWTYHPLNRTDDALTRVADVFRELADCAAEHNACIAMEGAFGHVCYDAKRLQQAIELVDRPNVKVIFDLYNYLDISNADRCYDILEEGLALFGKRIEVFHLKDFDVACGKLVQRPVGKGVLDYDRVLKAICRVDPDAKCVFEGTVGSDVPQAVQFIRSKLQRICN